MILNSIISFLGFRGAWSYDHPTHRNWQCFQLFTVYPFLWQRPSLKPLPTLKNWEHNKGQRVVSLSIMGCQWRFMIHMDVMRGMPIMQHWPKEIWKPVYWENHFTVTALIVNVLTRTFLLRLYVMGNLVPLELPNPLLNDTLIGYHMWSFADPNSECAVRADLLCGMLHCWTLWERPKASRNRASCWNSPCSSFTTNHDSWIPPNPWPCLHEWRGFEPIHLLDHSSRSDCSLLFVSCVGNDWILQRPSPPSERWQSE